MAEQLLDTFGLYGATFAFCFVAAAVPIVINVELYLIGVTLWAAGSPAELAAIVVIAAVGQMAAKVMVYFAGLGMLELPRGARARARIARARARLERWRRKPYWFFGLSALVGLPPFFLTCLAAGAMKIRFELFCLLGLAGRLARFATLVTIAWHYRG